MLNVEEIGNEGEQRFIKYLETIPGFIRAMKHVDKFHPYIDVVAEFTWGVEAFQVKTKSNYDERVGSMRCHKTGEMHAQCKNHGFEKTKFESWIKGKISLAEQSVPLSLIFAENSTGTILFCDPNTCGIRYGNGSGGVEFVYFNRDMMLVLCRPLPH